MNVGERIRAIRKSKGLTQIEVAEKAGIAVNSLRLYEAGKRKPNLGQIQAIAAALDGDVVYLISGQTTAEVEQGILIQAEAEAKYYAQSRFAEAEEWKSRVDEIGKDMAKLNDEGQLEAVKRVKELTEIAKYQCTRQPSPLSAGITAYGDEPAGSFPLRPQDAPQSSPASAETDTTQPTDAPEVPPEGK